MREELIKKIEEILKEMGVKNPDAHLDYPVYFDLGDYSTNVAMIYGRETGKSPMDLANAIKEKISGKIRDVKDVQVIKPGFINFFLDSKYFGDKVSQILKDPKKYTETEDFSGENYFVEHTQPNPFKAFHIGHLMNNTIGESIARIVKANSGNIQTATYHGDKGLHVAKAIWAIKKGKSLEEAYAAGNKAYDEDQTAKEEIIEINKKVYDESDSEINKIYEEGRQKSLEQFEKLYERLDSKFDFHFFESETGEVGKELVLKNVGKIFEKSDGAVVFKGENFEPKTHTRVFINSDGIPTYEAKELGLASVKRDFLDFDESITITGNEQDSFFKVVEVAVGEVMPELKDRLSHISHGMLRLPEGKMSSRTGNVISANSLIDHVKESISKNHEMEPKAAEEVALGAIKYSILRQSIGKDIIFDFDKSISFEGDSGPYLQYSAVRANSLLKNAEGKVKMDSKMPEDWQVTTLEKMLERFPNVLTRAGKEFAPNYIATYLIQLAGEFNLFYSGHKIIDENDKTSSYRLGLVKAFVEVMNGGLNLLAIKVPHMM